MTSFNLNDILKALSPNIVTWRLGLQQMNFGGHNPVHRRCGLGFGIFLKSQMIPNGRVNLRTTEINHYLNLDLLKKKIKMDSQCRSYLDTFLLGWFKDLY